MWEYEKFRVCENERVLLMLRDEESGRWCLLSGELEGTIPAEY
jgi:hypothetical protein